MLQKTLLLDRMEDVKAFVELTMQKPYDIELRTEKYIVNAKSIMGVFSLDLTKPLELVAHCEPDDPLALEVAPYLLENRTPV